MKCEKCGKETDFLEVDMFDYEGTDDWYMVETYEESGVVFLNVLPNWTGDELDEDEQADSIRCPHCKQYPFISRNIETCKYVNVQMYPKDYGETINEL